MRLSLLSSKRQSRLLPHSNSAFSYHNYPLVAISSIRVIELRKNKEDEAPLEGSLICSDITSSYVALSYCWGEPSQSDTILIDGCIFKITEQLRNALRRIRRGSHRRIWVDQICINQNDEVEKTQQVRMMSEIYSNAKYTFAYLGPDTDNLAPLMQRLGRKSYGRYPEPQRDPSMHDQMLKTMQLHGSGARDVIFALYRFWSIAFFSRIWIVQECVLPGPKRIRFLLGTHTLEWKDIRAGYWALSHIDMSKMWLEDEYSDLTNFEKTILERMTWTAGISRMHTLVERMDEDLRPDFRGKLKLYTLTDFLQYMTCKDPRDRFFALHSMATDPVLPNIDYSKSVAEVYIEHNTDFIRDGYGSFLIWKVILSNKLQADDIPSWCLRHTTEADAFHESASGLRFLTTDEDNACIGGPVGAPYLITEEVIRLKAMTLDVIKVDDPCPADLPLMHRQDEYKIARFMVDGIQKLAIHHFINGHGYRSAMMRALDDFRKLILPLARQFAVYADSSIADEWNRPPKIGIRQDHVLPSCCRIVWPEILLGRHMLHQQE